MEEEDKKEVCHANRIKVEFEDGELSVENKVEHEEGELVLQPSKLECGIMIKNKYFNKYCLNLQAYSWVEDEDVNLISLETLFIPGQLKKPNISHIGDKLLSCSQCDKLFSSESSLNRHILSHTGKKLFVCSHCGKSYFQSGIRN